jgi:hypothetical protein
MNTKAAFEALNAAFGSRSAIDHSSAQAAPTVASGDLFIRQDTSLRTDTHPALAHASSSFDIREDTVYINPRSAAAAEAVAEIDSGGGLAIREDTIFIKPKVQGAASQATSVDDNEDTDVIGREGGGLSIREDTIFINRTQSGEAQASIGGLSIREDTVFLNRGEAAAGIDNADDDDTVDVGIYNKWGLDPAGADDTLAFNSRDMARMLAAPAAVAASPRPAAGSPTRTPRELPTALPAQYTGLSSDLQELQLAPTNQEVEEITSPGNGLAAAAAANSENENDENAPPAGMPRQPQSVTPRDLRDPSVGDLSLLPLSTERASKLLVAIESDAEAEAALAALLPEQEQQLPVGDSFQVYADDPNSISTASVSQVIDPFSSGFQAHMLSMLSPPVAEWPGVVTITTEEETPALALFKRMQRAGAPSLEVKLANNAYAVQRSIGSGAYATVYQAFKEEEGGAKTADVALKVEVPACPWEWYICKVVAGRVVNDRRSCFLNPYALTIGPGASIMEMPRGTHGSLQDVLNVYLKKGERPEEVVVARLTVNLMHILGDLHAARVLHNDIKPDNVLIRFGSGGEDSDGVGLQLIDFGRSVDLELLPPGSVMCGDCGTEAFRCVEMREERPWLWQADAYGAAGVVHCLLFGEYMEVERVMNAEGFTYLRIKALFRRYWQGEMWGVVFNKLLNWTCLDAGAPPPWVELATMLEQFLDGSKDGERKEQNELNKLKYAL